MEKLIKYAYFSVHHLMVLAHKIQGSLQGMSEFHLTRFQLAQHKMKKQTITITPTLMMNTIHMKIQTNPIMNKGELKC